MSSESKKKNKHNTGKKPQMAGAKKPSVQAVTKTLPAEKSVLQETLPASRQDEGKRSEVKRYRIVRR